MLYDVFSPLSCFLFSVSRCMASCTYAVGTYIVCDAGGKLSLGDRSVKCDAHGKTLRRACLDQGAKN